MTRIDETIANLTAARRLDWCAERGKGDDDMIARFELLARKAEPTRLALDAAKYLDLFRSIGPTVPAR